MYYFLLSSIQLSVIYDFEFSKGNMVLILWSMCAQGWVYVCVCVCVCAQSLSCVQLFVTNPMDCNPPGSSFHGIFQTRIPERVAICYDRGSSQLREQTIYLVSPALAGWRRKWQPTPVLLPGESQEWRSLLGAFYGVSQSWTRLMRLSSSSSSTSRKIF